MTFSAKVTALLTILLLAHGAASAAPRCAGCNGSGPTPAT
jgi:hypothetical protein